MYRANVWGINLECYNLREHRTNEQVKISGPWTTAFGKNHFGHLQTLA